MFAVGVFSANEWVYPDSQPGDKPAGPIALVAARGGRVACQLLVSADAAAEEVALAIEPEGEPGLPDAEVFELRDVMVEKNTGRDGFVARDADDPLDYVTRRAPFRVYDAMRPSPAGTGRLRQGRAAFYVRWRVAAAATAGTMRARLRVIAGGAVVEIPLELTIVEALVPSEGRLRVTNWFSLDNMATRHGLEPWSEDHWDMIGAYAALMRRGRQNNFLLPLSTVGITESKAGTYLFDFSRVERLATLFFSLGFTCLEGGHLGSRRHFGDAEFVLSARPDIAATGPQGYTFLAQYLPAWYGFLRDHGWLDRVIQYVGDEPIDASAQDYRVLAGIVRKFMPGIPLIDAVERPGLGGSVDIWVPKNSYYQEHREDFEAHRQLGDTLWFYTCCIPGGQYMNRLLDMPLLRTRYLHWGNYRYDLAGFLHWGLNHYKSFQDPFEENAPAHGEGGTSNLPPGDTHIVYPGSDGPWPSVRLEAMAMGIEDYELLCLVAAGDRPRADAICASVFQAFDQAVEDTDAFDVAHRALLEAASSRLRG